MSYKFWLIKSGEVAFNQEDINRFIHLEEGQKRLPQRIDDIRDILYIVSGGIIALTGFVVWDKRTAISPFTKRTRRKTG